MEASLQWLCLELRMVSSQLLKQQLMPSLSQRFCQLVLRNLSLKMEPKKEKN